MTCPLCDTPWAKHPDTPCLHAVIAALEGKWVKCKDGGYRYYSHEIGVFLEAWGPVPNYTQHEYAWQKLVEWCATGHTLAGSQEFSLLAVLIAWVVWKMSS